MVNYSRSYICSSCATDDNPMGTVKDLMTMLLFELRLLVLVQKTLRAALAKEILDFSCRVQDTLLLIHAWTGASATLLLIHGAYLAGVVYIIAECAGAV